MAGVAVLLARRPFVLAGRLKAQPRHHKPGFFILPVIRIAHMMSHCRARTYSPPANKLSAWRKCCSGARLSGIGW